MSNENVEDFCSSLSELTVNSKPHINMLTMLAEDYINVAPDIVKAVEDQLKCVPSEVKLPVLYLIDSIVKNVGKTYVPLFGKNIVQTFVHAFEKVDEKARSQLYKLRQTWVDYFHASKLYALDTKVHAIDPAWPITAAPAKSSIHVNPLFLSQSSPALPIPPDPSQELLKQRKELLELQKKKVELELRQTKAILEGQKVRGGGPPQNVVRIPPATNIILRAKASVAAAESKTAQVPVAALVAPVRIRDPRLRKEPSPKETASPAPEPTTPNRVVLSPVASPSNQSSSDSPPKAGKKDGKKVKKSKDARSPRKSDSLTPPKSKDKKSRAVEVLRDLEEELIREKGGQVVIGTETVINKAKQHDLKKDDPSPKLAESSGEASSEKVVQETRNHRNSSPVRNDLSSKASPKKSSPMKRKASPEKPKVPSPVPERASPLRTPPPPPIIEPKTIPADSPKRRKIDAKTSSPRKKSKKSSLKRKRDSSPSPKSSPKRTPVRPSTPPTVQEPDIGPSALEADILVPGHDTDLRLLTAQNIELESSPKKTNAETLDDLFGKEDVDLRALPPPPPIISRPTPPNSPPAQSKNSPERTKSWANLKRTNSDGSPESTKKSKPERRKSDKFNKSRDDDENFDETTEEAAKEQAEMIMKDAEEQLNNGNITFAQYNNLLKEVITMNEKRRLKEAMRRDQDYEWSKSPSPAEERVGGDGEVVNNNNKKKTEEPPSDMCDDVPPAPPPPEINERDFRLRDDRRRLDDRGRYDRRDRRYDQRNAPKPPPWMPPMMSQRGLPRRGGGRWAPRYDRFPPTNQFPVGGNREVPPADPTVLEMIAKDPMKTINIDGVPREIRFYGETAVIMMSWDDPRELNFQPGQRRISFNDRESFVLQFNAPYKEVCVDGMFCKVRFGAPTRELFVDGVFYEGIFGGPPFQVRIGNMVHSVRLHGPLPNVRIGNESRRDLVAGKVSLIVDGNAFFTIYLDAKPQRFDIGGVPYILRFVEALQTVVINGVPFKIEFGSNLPVPMYFHGEKHYLRFSALPQGIKPGYLTIINMEGGRLPSPPPPSALPLPIVHEAPMRDAVVPGRVNAKQPEQPLELLTSLMPSFSDQGIGQGYTVEEASRKPDVSGPINVAELLKKLQAVGIMPAADKKVDRVENVNVEIVPVSFDSPETLRTRQPGLIHTLYSGMQCSSCGVRFPPEQTGKYSQHLDWHFRQNRRERDAMRVAQSRRYNYDVSDWIQYQEIEEKEDRAQSWFEMQEKRNFEEEVEDELSVPAGEKGENASCELCRDKFDQFYNEEKEEWHLRRAIEVDGKLYHPLCHRDREENNLVLDSSKLDKPVLLVPTVVEEPELIEIPDDKELASDDVVLGMPIDEKVETIDLDSEQSSSKDGLEEKKTGEGDEGNDEVDDDDDILECEVIDPKIETYELSDEEKVEDGDDDEEQRNDFGEDKVDDEPEQIEVDLAKVKREKLEIVDLDAAQTVQPLVVSSIDGNVELEDAAPVALPRRIVINIPSAVSKPAPAARVASPPPPPSSEPDAIPPPVVDASEPPPPGEELYPVVVKPRISASELQILPPVNKGSELSALCSIM